MTDWDDPAYEISRLSASLLSEMRLLRPGDNSTGHEAATTFAQQFTAACSCLWVARSVRSRQVS